MDFNQAASIKHTKHPARRLRVLVGQICLCAATTSDEKRQGRRSYRAGKRTAELGIPQPSTCLAQLDAALPGPAAAAALGFCPERLGRINAFVNSIVDEGKAPMAVVGVVRHGQLAHLSMAGHQDLERMVPLAQDSIFRMYSMTKPVVSIALLMLYEEGRFESFDEPISKYIPCFKDVQVYVSGDTAETLVTRPPKSPITIKQLLMHTSGLTYGFVPDVPAVSKMYRDVQGGPGASYTLEEHMEKLAKKPLICDPGSEWHYSLATDVVGRLVEVLSGKALAQFLKERIFEPLGMQDTGFSVPADKVHRFAASYRYSAKRTDGKFYELDEDPKKSTRLEPFKGFASGGGGLVSTLPDWIRWMQFLLRKGATPGGVRLLGLKTYEYAALNHLPGKADLEVFGAKATNHKNVVYKKGQGWTLLGFSMIQDPVRYDAVCSAGELAWGSLASGYLWVDHKEDLAVILKTQMMPSSTYGWRRHLHALVYQALLDPCPS